MASFDIVSFNMHGFNQGEEMARYICDDLSVDVQFLQEHWLSTDMLHKLCTISSDYLVCGISAMDNVLANNVLVGRPYGGGVFTLIRSSNINSITNHACSDRFNIISIGFIFSVNVYLPSSPQGDVLHLFQTTLDEIFSIVIILQFTLLIFGGDINCNLAELNPVSRSLVSSLNGVNATHCIPPPNTNTYGDTQGMLLV